MTCKDEKHTAYLQAFGYCPTCGNDEHADGNALTKAIAYLGAVEVAPRVLPCPSCLHYHGNLSCQRLLGDSYPQHLCGCKYSYDEITGIEVPA